MRKEGATQKTVDAIYDMKRVVNPSLLFLGNGKHNTDVPRKTLERLAKIYDLQYRWVPAKGYELSDETHEDSRWSFVVKNSLDRVVSLVAVLAGLTFLSSNITGNVIGSLSSPSSNLIGASLFHCLYWA